MQWNLWQSDIDVFCFFWTLYNSMCLYGPGYYAKLCEFTVSLVICDSSLYFCLGIFILMYRWTDTQKHKNTQKTLMECVGLGIFNYFFFCLAPSSQFSIILCYLSLLSSSAPFTALTLLFLSFFYLIWNLKFNLPFIIPNWHIGYNWTKNA